MIRRSLTTLSLLALAAAPLAAQDKDDPTQKVAGGALPAGWMGRTDRATDKLTDAKFVAMGPGYHVTSGPAAIYWNPKTVTSGPFVASTTITQTKAPDASRGVRHLLHGEETSTRRRRTTRISSCAATGSTW